MTPGFKGELGPCVTTGLVDSVDCVGESDGRGLWSLRPAFSMRSFSSLIKVFLFKHPFLRPAPVPMNGSFLFLSASISSLDLLWDPFLGPGLL